MLNDKLFGYLDEQKIEYFGSPMMTDDSEPVDFDPKSPSDYTFVFDIGIKPSFTLDYGQQNPIEIKIPGTNQKALDEDIIRYRRIFGTDEVIEGGHIESTDKVGVSLQRLDENGQEAGGP
jgi:FKBP-type peptidyl-prolyl cis-trans isomerase (trigger factor)